MAGAEVLTIMGRTPATTPPSIDDAEEDSAWDYPTRSLVSAADLPAPSTRSPRSIFDMAAAASTAKLLKSVGRFGAAQGFVPSTTNTTATRVDGVVRVVGCQYPAARWTPERDEKERQRRARQKPPKPTKRAKRRSKKLLAVIGDDLWDE
jgi:hypothetical protein